MTVFSTVSGGLTSSRHFLPISTKKRRAEGSPPYREIFYLDEIGRITALLQNTAKETKFSLD